MSTTCCSFDDAFNESYVAAFNALHAFNTLVGFFVIYASYVTFVYP
jgi:hypothetical protein